MGRGAVSLASLSPFLGISRARESVRVVGCIAADFFFYDYLAGSAARVGGVVSAKRAMAAQC